MDTLVGIEIGGTKLQIATGDLQARLLERRRYTVDRDEGATGIRHRLETALRETLDQTRPRSVGIGFGGPVDWQTGAIRRSHQIEGWTGFPLASWIQSTTACPVTVENDANTAALGEALHGAARGCNPVFYVTLGSGVGGGLVVDGAIYHGAIPGEAEIGHLRLDRSGTTVESRCSGWAVDARIRQFVNSAPESRLAHWAATAQGSEARCLSSALQEGNQDAQTILQEVASDLASALSHVVHLFHPEVIVLGGGLSLVGDPLLTTVANALTPCLMEAFRPGPSLRLAALGEDAVPVGALLLAARAAGVSNPTRPVP